MKIYTLLAALLLSVAAGFTPHPDTSRVTLQLKANLFDNLFKPFHGHGSGEGHYKEMLDEEKALLKERQSRFKKPDLKKRYGKKEGWLDTMMHPVHGHGSGETHLDEMYQAQQQLLYERREYYGNKDMLKKKYRDTKHDHHDEIKPIRESPALLNKKEDDAMWIDDSAPTFEWPWDKKNKLRP